ncbi:hypothetical protein GCM10022393_05920 [Aquimarina addita]|uniref:DUF5689 domain-containing protein n=1 Tax=Aquimarina addita TaxID=870485 RepID=A0ABP7XBP7_9FLAO
MNIMNVKKRVTVLLVTILITSCVQNDDFDIPVLAIEESVIPESGIIGIGAVLGSLAQEQLKDDAEAIITFDTPDQFVQGYVISSDRAGNFFKELIIQNAKENPTAGIRIAIDVNPMFTSYEFGRKVYIKLAGLSLGISNGVPTLGVLDGKVIGQIPSFSQNEYIIRSSEITTITPLELGIEDFSNNKLSMFIKINDVQFNKDAVLGTTTHTFAAEPTDQYDGERILESCTLGYSCILSTSTFSDFKGVLLPEKQGSIEGILTKNFFGDAFNIVINDPTALVFDNPERFDFSCGTADIAGTTVLFSDDFETQTNRKPITGNGWTIFTQEGTETWEAYTSDGTNPSQGISARVSSYGSEDERTIAWLVTPSINLDQQEGETLHFETSNSFADLSNLDIVFSKNWDGNPTTIANARWITLSEGYIIQNSDDFDEWYSSGIIDLSCETGVVYIAFRYTGSDTEDFDGTYELDNISIDYN